MPLGTLLGLGLWQRAAGEKDPNCILHAFCTTAVHNSSHAAHTDTSAAHVTAAVAGVLRYSSRQFIYFVKQILPCLKRGVRLILPV